MMADSDIGPAEVALVNEVLHTRALSCGPMVERFEQEWAARLGTRFAVAVSSGTTGLHLAMIAAGVTDGDAVITSPYSFVASANAILHQRGVPVFVDVEPGTHNLDPTKIEAAITPRTRGILPVHIGGRPCDMDAIMAIAKRNKLLVIEDTCQGIGGSYKGRKFGTIGDVGAFSFNYYKNITCGEGGGVTSNDPKVMERARCAIDPCHFYWQGRKDSLQPFSGIGVRACGLLRMVFFLAMSGSDRRLSVRGCAVLPDRSPAPHCGCGNCR